MDRRSALLDITDELDEGEGVNRETLIETAADELGESRRRIERDIEKLSAVGQLYEPSRGYLSAL